jgi:hypothetical protein
MKRRFYVKNKEIATDKHPTESVQASQRVTKSKSGFGRASHMFHVAFSQKLGPTLTNLIAVVSQARMLYCQLCRFIASLNTKEPIDIAKVSIVYYKHGYTYLYVYYASYHLSITSLIIYI